MLTEEQQRETDGFMRQLAMALDHMLNEPDNKKWGFALLVYPFNGGAAPDRQRMNYVGNGNRDDVLKAMKEIVARWEGRFIETETKQ